MFIMFIRSLLGPSRGPVEALYRLNGAQNGHNKPDKLDKRAKLNKRYSLLY